MAGSPDEDRLRQHKTAHAAVHNASSCHVVNNFVAKCSVLCRDFLFLLHQSALVVDSTCPSHVQSSREKQLMVMVAASVNMP